MPFSLKQLWCHNHEQSHRGDGHRPSIVKASSVVPISTGHYFKASSSTSSPSKAIFAQDGHRPSIHCIKTPTRPQAQLKTATGFKHGHGEVLRASRAAFPPPPRLPAPFARPGPRWVVVEKYKTRLGRFHEQVLCNKGSGCTFAHSEADLNLHWQSALWSSLAARTL